MLSFRFLGFPVRVHWMFWVTGVLLSGALNVEGRELFVVLLTWVPVVFVSILWHEIGHGQAFKKYGLRSEILLYGMGGLCSAPGGRLTRHQDMWVSAAGPAASICLYGFTLGAAILMGLRIHFGWLGAVVIDLDAHGHRTILMRVMNSLLWVNGFWALINLLPVQPLDGGHVFAAYMANKKPHLVPKVGMITAAAVAILAWIYLGSIYLPIFFGYLAYTNWKRSQGTHGGFW